MGILLTLIIGALLQWYFCCNCSTKTKKSETVLVDKSVTNPDVKATPFVFRDGNLSIKSQDNLNFFESGHTVIQPISEHLTSCLQELSSCFKQNSNKTLKITGLYSDKEDNLSDHETLGLARAWAIKDHLVELGVPKNQIEINGKVNNSLKASAKNILFGPYTFDTFTNKKENTKLLELKKAAEKHSVLVHFLPGRFHKTLNTQEQKRLRAVANYLNASDTASCTIIGHTDSVGSEESNKVHGQKRAEFTKGKLVKFNVSPNKIKLTSKGESSPIATNATKSGKTKNRRTEIQLK